MQVKEVLFEVYFVKGFDIGDYQVLIMLVLEIGFDVNIVLDLFVSDVDVEMIWQEQLLF